MLKSARNLIYKMAPAITAFIAFVLTLHVNSSSGCYILYQPKAPAALDQFKKIK